MYHVIIWGTGRGYSQHFNLIKYYELIGEISIVGIISNDQEITTMLDGYKFYKKNQIKNVNFDYCIVTIQDIDAILPESTELGISQQKLIPIRVLEIPYFSFKKYIYLKKEGISIFSRNCWAGICYHHLALEFQSPTINMFFTPLDFNKFVTNLDYYLSLPLEFSEMQYEKNLKRDYPVGRLNDIFLHFNHYTSFEEAASAWTRRKKRICKNIVIVSSASDRESAIEFSKLPYKNKLMFIPRELNIEHESLFPINYHDNNDGYTIGMYSNGTANGILNMIDLLSFLCQINYKRIV